jgi:YHS domain-containing protein
MKQTESCPVCGMDVEVDADTETSKYKGETYYFCGEGCKEKFDENPQQYVGKSATQSKSGSMSKS